MTYIRFFFVLYWFAPFLKFGLLPSKNSRCVPVLVNTIFKLNKSFFVKINFFLSGFDKPKLVTSITSFFLRAPCFYIFYEVQFFKKNIYTIYIHHKALLNLILIKSNLALYSIKSCCLTGNARLCQI